MNKILLPGVVASFFITGAANAAVTINSETTVSGNTVDVASLNQTIQATGGGTMAGAGGIVTMQAGVANATINVTNNQVKTGAIKQTVTTGSNGFTEAAVGGIVVEQVGGYGNQATVSRNTVTTGSLTQTVSNTGGAVEAGGGGIVVLQ